MFSLLRLPLHCVPSFCLHSWRRVFRLFRCLISFMYLFLIRNGARMLTNVIVLRSTCTRPLVDKGFPRFHSIGVVRVVRTRQLLIYLMVHSVCRFGKRSYVPRLLSNLIDRAPPFYAPRFGTSNGLFRMIPPNLFQRNKGRRLRGTFPHVPFKRSSHLPPRDAHPSMGANGIRPISPPCRSSPDVQISSAVRLRTLLYLAGGETYRALTFSVSSNFVV